MIKQKRFIFKNRLQTFSVLALTVVLGGCCSSGRTDNVSEAKRLSDQYPKSPITHSYVNPVRIVWASDDGSKGYVVAAENLLKSYEGQLTTTSTDMCVLKSDRKHQASIVLDFGRELHGAVELSAGIRAEKNPVKIRIRLGESVSEAMSTTGGNTPETSATNDHAMRDYVTELPWLGTTEIGNSGFRFVRIDLLDEGVSLPLKSVRAVFKYRDIPYLGSFECSDERLNKIWETGAYTVHLNMQEYLWDGIKRDRLVWLGDVHPEVMTINTVFGSNEVVNKSLAFGRETTPLPGWMNGMSAYSLWWIISNRDLYLYQGDKAYLQEQLPYMKELLTQIASCFNGQKEALTGGRFLDWPTSTNQNVVHSGLQALVKMTAEAVVQIAGWVQDQELLASAQELLSNMEGYVPMHHDNKQAAALLTLSGLISGEDGAAVLERDGASGFSTFYGYYMLEALAKAGKYDAAMKIMSDYWGAMLDLGATTFWEDLTYENVANAAPIDQIVPEGKFDIHADGGDFCYKGLRHSLCHGWASGPTAWLSRYVLGVMPLEPGCAVVEVTPHLGSLTYAKGTFPTPHGVIRIEHVKQPDGTIQSEIDAPKGVKIVQK